LVMTIDVQVAPSPDLGAACESLAVAEGVVEGAIQHLARSTGGSGNLDDHASLAYDLAHAGAEMAIARNVLTTYATLGTTESYIACVFAADAIKAVAGRTTGRERAWATVVGWHAPVEDFLATWCAPTTVGALADQPGERHLGADFALAAAAFRHFAEERIGPLAERIHRHNTDIPDEVIRGLAELGGFGISVPEAYGGSASGGPDDYLGMVVATEELSRVSLGAGGSLITRPEILTRALVAGGTEEQRARWLPIIAGGDQMVAVAVTEPDFGSDVANLRLTATPVAGGYLIDGVKTWTTFAARAEILMLLARTEADRSLGHRGLSLFIVSKERGEGRGFVQIQDDSVPGRPPGLRAGRLEGRPIDTIGYRGMHSYEVSFDGWWVSEDRLIGGEGGRNRGFYLQMAGFENGRIQTAARAVGVMQAAYEAGLDYAGKRTVFGRPLVDLELTRHKLGRMVAVIQASRQFTYRVAGMMATGRGSLEASMVKAYACRAAEWVTREAMQLHGGMGYAEEFPVSRYFADARVLSIFEGADETLCIRVIARRLLERAGAA
jgi:(2S)-methylsuccinyl-CoA dehydrogenase